MSVNFPSKPDPGANTIRHYATLAFRFQKCGHERPQLELKGE